MSNVVWLFEVDEAQSLPRRLCRELIACLSFLEDPAGHILQQNREASALECRRDALFVPRRRS